MRTISLGFLTLLIVVSCDSTTTDTEDPSTLSGTIINRWQFVGVIQKSNNQRIDYPSEFQQAELSIKDNGKLLFIGPCNTGGGDITTQPNQGVIIENLFMTEIACTPLKVMDWEQRMISGFEEAYQYSFEGNELTIISKSDYHLIFKQI